MEIRLGNASDLNVCLALDDSFETEYVWQMEEQNRTGEITASFRLTHLPRPMRVRNTITGDQIRADYERGAALIVADQDGIRGFVQAVRSDWNQSIEIRSLVVGFPFRRRGVGSQLVRAAMEWGRLQKMRMALLDMSTKNHPAVSFIQKQGFQFCGFHDKLYPNRDIALFFSALLH